ncbi:MAG: two-component sensor histidine kinase [Alphaproteobacteria bacterium]|nr:MAG: two-component sensor histidine kinase [Alphaproteobacteria bacterium]
MALKRVPLRTIIKVVGIATLPSLVVLSLFAVNERLSISSFLFGYIAVWVGTWMVVVPLLMNLRALTEYIFDLSEDKKTLVPELNVLKTIFNIPEALLRLRAVWDHKAMDMQMVIREGEVIVDTLPDILLMLNDRLHIVRTNRAARTVFGQNLAKKKIESVIPSRLLLDAVVAVNEDFRGREVEFRLEEPVVRDFLAVIERLSASDKGGVSLVITMNDITELKSVEQMRADFVANASHEIRTPLASISGLIETIRGPARDDDKAIDEFLEIMAEQAERMRQLINDLLSLSKIEMNAHTPPIDRVDFVKVVQREIKMFDLIARQKKVHIVLDVPDDVPDVIGERNELAQVVHNLVGNALKYGSANSEVLITVRVTTELPPDIVVRSHTRMLLFSVRDEGEGIAKEHLARLTERFYRVDSARTRQVGGTGLGLAIVKGILTRHKGVISITSTVGKGSVFSVYVPLYDA